MLPVHLVWKTLKNSLLTLLYNKLIGPDLSLLIMSDYPNLPPSFFPDLIPATTTVALGTPLRCGPPPLSLRTSRRGGWVKNNSVRGGPLLGAKMARGFDRTSHGSSLFLFVKIHHHYVTDCFRPYESLIRSGALIFLTLGTCTVQLCCQFICYGKL